MEFVTSFEPIVDDRSKIVILGTMPGAESIRKGQYYANPRNHFWKIIGSLFPDHGATALHEAPYEQKMRFLKDKRIALWDVLAHCEREGSLDSRIRNEIPNDFFTFFARHPGLRYVMFNGTAAEKLFRKHIGDELPFPFVFKQLPSTSPANTIPLQAKLESWKTVKAILEASEPPLPDAT